MKEKSEPTHLHELKSICYYQEEAIIITDRQNYDKKVQCTPMQKKVFFCWKKNFSFSLQFKLNDLHFHTHADENSFNVHLRMTKKTKGMDFLNQK